MSPSFMQQLKARTRRRHEQVEANPRMAQLMTDAVTRADHADLTARLLGFHAPLEARLLAHPARSFVESSGIDLGARVKAPALRRDLRALGWDDRAIAAVPGCEALPPLGDADAIFGGLYVLEGATLGGQVIGRHLARTLGLGPETGAAYHGVYGERVGPMWRAFGRALETYAASSEADFDALVAGADATFAALDAWLHAEMDASAARTATGPLEQPAEVR